MSSELVPKTQTGKKVKLYFAQHFPKETVIDSIAANEWGDFIVVAVKNMSSEDQLRMSEVLSAYGKKTDKVIILVPDDHDISFYGVEIDEDSSRNETEWEDNTVS